MKRIAALFILSLVLLSITCACLANNETYLDEVKLSISFPDGYYLITRSTPYSDSFWTESGLNPSTVFTQMNEEQAYLMAFSKDWSKMITINMSPYDTGEDFLYLSDQKIKEECSSAVEEKNNANGYTTNSSDVRNYGNAKYYTYSFYAPDYDVHCITYLTVVDKQLISISCVSYSGEFSYKDLWELDTIVDSINYTRENNYTTKTTKNADIDASTNSTSSASLFIKIGIIILILGMVLLFNRKRHSSNGLKAAGDLQRIKMTGGTAKMSLSQVVLLISNNIDAKRNLSSVEYQHYKTLFDMFRKEKKQVEVDFMGYIGLCEQIISAYEKYFPYLLVDGSHSHNLELRNQIRIRQLFEDGIKFQSALDEYESSYEKINCEKYDCLNDPYSKLICNLSFTFSEEFASNILKAESFDDYYGYLLGIADALFIHQASKVGSAASDESKVTLYTLHHFGIKDYSDKEIEVIMKERKVTSMNTVVQIENKPDSQICEICEKALIEKYKPTNNRITMHSNEIRKMIKELMSQFGAVTLTQKMFVK